ncbi:MAG: discoidin domain-containing protein, partial [Desulfobulbaceae bacterium]|nr:discoidin domain-containing protein [Desulfobulbaceae bacterium]
VVVAKPASNNDAAPCVVRIRNINYTGFEIRLQAWDYLDEEHGEESVSFIVMERGSFTLDDGTLLEAGRFATDKTSSYENVNFSQSFNTVPVVSASVVSVNEEDAVVGRISGINETGFGYKLREQEINALEHTLETIAYIAWEPSVGMIGDLAYEVGTTGDVVTHAWHTINFAGGFTDVPVFISDMQTTDGGDTSVVRCINGGVDGTEVLIEEEQSRDSEVSHTTENVGFMAFSVIDMAGDADNDGLGDAGDNSSELPQEITPTNSAMVSASSYEDPNTPDNTIDNSLLTRWSTYGEGEWIEYDLGTEYTISEIAIAWLKIRINYFHIETSVDGVIWTEVYGTASNWQEGGIATTALEVHDITDSIGRYVRIVGHGNSEHEWNSITEVEIWGD